MILNEQAFQKLMEAPGSRSVYYFYSTEEYLAQSFATRTVTALCRETDSEVTRIDGPAPSIEEAVAAAGTISLFGTRRIVELPRLEPSAMKDADVAALCDLMQSLENAVLVLYTVFKDDKAKTTKKAKSLQDAAQKAGVCAELVKPGAAEARRLLAQEAKALGASFAPGADAALLERCGTDLFLLENEVSKLAAAAQYGTITTELVTTMGTRNIEADVFDMVRFVTAKNKVRALAKLRALLELQNDPIAIAAALSGAFVDMYRMQCGTAVRKNAAAVQKDFGYRGSDYRLRKAGESAARYTRKQLECILERLEQLDAALKSSAADKDVLLQTTLCEILQIGESRL